ncbi:MULTISPECIES: hypothetical protein [unclassified Microbacterium]|uniref:DUF7489 domain-containing protein n=1 Tax=unclassified Microbacterium TaxID=2609290 RepID=UPI003669B510
MGHEDSWSGTVVNKSHGLTDGSNLYRRVTVETDGGGTEKVRVDRALWDELSVGDRLVKDPDGKPVRA